MVSKDVLKIMAEARQKAKDGVEYSVRYGALCPLCGRRMKVVKTEPWIGSTRIRYHRCLNEQCVLHAMRIGVKSTQVDPCTVLPPVMSGATVDL